MLYRSAWIWHCTDGGYMVDFDRWYLYPKPPVGQRYKKMSLASINRLLSCKYKSMYALAMQDDIVIVITFPARA